MAKQANQDKERDFQEIANEHGHSCLAWIAENVRALEHAQECNGTDEDGNDCKVGADSENPDAWHNEDDARRDIDERPLSIQIRDGWRSPGENGEPEEYEILLGTGGPATRIRGELDGETPSTAVFEYQDWFKPWTAATDLSNEEEETLLKYAQQFYFGE